MKILFSPLYLHFLIRLENRVKLGVTYLDQKM